MIDWISLFVGLVLGFVLGSVLSYKNRPSEVSKIVDFIKEELDRKNIFHTSFYIDTIYDDDGDDGDDSDVSLISPDVSWRNN